MQISHELGKKIIIFGVAFFVLFVLLLVMFKINNTSVPVASPDSKGDISSSLIKDEADLNNMDADLSSLDQGDSLSAELDATLNEVGEIDETTEVLVEDEEALSGLDSDLDSLSGDEATGQEIDQALQEMSL